MDVYYNNDSATFNRVHNLAIAKTNWQTLTGISIDVFWTETFKKAIGHATGKPLGRNQGNPQTADNTTAVYNIMPCTKHTGSTLDKAPPPFYPFSSKAEYT